MQRVILALALMLGFAIPAFAQDRPRVTFGANYTFSPANESTKDFENDFGLELTGLNQAYSPSVDVRLFGPVSVGLRQGIYQVNIADSLIKYRSRSFDISAGAELSKRADISVLLLGGPTLFYETIEVPGFGKESETNMGFHVGGEVTYFFHSHVGTAGSVIFNSGGDGAGFTRIGGGVRFRF
jgi:hypothetical protein